MKRDIKKEIVKKVHFNHGTGLYELSKYQIDDLTDELEKLFAIPVVTQQSEPLINSDFAKYLAANYPTLLFDVTTAIESYSELINGG